MNPSYSRRGLLSSVAGIVTGSAPKAADKWRGVNLGGWLVLEKWMTPRLFTGSTAGDEFAFCAALGPKAAEAKLKAHRAAFITDADFKWIADHGLNAVRLPIGYWALEGDGPFVLARETLDFALRTARKYDLGVVVDLHGAPGSQNGWDHSGRAGEIKWASRENVGRTLDLVENLAGFLRGFESVIAVELLNEPRWDVPLPVLKSYYEEGYRRVRKQMDKRVAVVVHDGFRPFDWANFMKEPEFTGVLLDTHLYQCYEDADRKRSIDGHVQKAAVERRQQVQKTAAQLPTIVGEWSIALPPEVLAGLKGFARDNALRAYGAAQLLSYESVHGWFYWSYKNEAFAEWSFRESVNRGWLPELYGG